MDAPALTAFVAVIDAGSAHAAARRLGLSQAALSRRLQRLEESLGFKLFVRAGRRLALSERGALLLPQVRTHLDGLSNALAAARHAAHYVAPTVTFGCLPTLSMTILPKALDAVLRRYPDIRLRLVDLSATEIRASVADGSADFALTYLGIEEPGLSQHLIAEEPMVLVVADQHPLAREWRQGMPWSALDGVELIAIGPQSGVRRLLEDARPIIGRDLYWAHEVQHIASALRLIAGGFAATLAPLLAIPPGEEGLRTISIGAEPLNRRLGTIWRSGERLAPEAETLRRELSGALRKELASRVAQLQSGFTVGAAVDPVGIIP